MKPERDDVIDYIGAQIVSACADEGIPQEKAAQIAVRVSVITRKTYHGTQYIAKTNRADRNTLIMRESTGNNKDEICKKYDLSESQYYRIINQMRNSRQKTP